MEPPTAAADASAVTARRARIKAEANTRFVRTHYAAALQEHRGSWAAVPAHDKLVLRTTCALAPADEAKLVAALESDLLQPSRPLSARVRPGTASARVASMSPRRQAPRVAKAQSKLRAYIQAPVAGHHDWQRKHAEAVSILRVINELQLRIPPFRRLALAHGTDFTDPNVQYDSFIDVFGLIDEYGEQCVTIEQVVGFGRKVGGVTARLLSRQTFAATATNDGNTFTRDEFMAALFPQITAQRRADAAAARVAAGLHSSTPGSPLRDTGAGDAWRHAWPAADLEVLMRIYALCDPKHTGFVTLAGLQEVSPPDWLDSWGGGRYSMQRLFDNVDSDGDGKITLPELAALLQPSFEAARRQVEPDEPVLYFEHVRAGW